MSKSIGKARLFRYYLKKDFPSNEIVVSLKDQKVGKVKIDNSIELFFSIDFKRDKNDIMFFTMYNSLKDQIKNSLFQVKKKRTYLKKQK